MGREEDSYSILGVNSEASQEEIKKAYRKIISTRHPDKFTDPKEKSKAEEEMGKVNAAYEKIKTPEKRASYDAMKRGGMGEMGFDFGNFDVNGGAGGKYADIFDNFFDAFMNRQTRQTKSNYNVPKSGEDIQVDVVLTIEEAFSGKIYKATLNRYVKCKQCSHTGFKKANKQCGSCFGNGFRETTKGIWKIREKCSYCAGTGIDQGSFCKECGGLSRKLATEMIEIEIPEGYKEKVIIRGKGNDGQYNGGPGNLVCRINYKEDHPLRVVGKDIVCSAHISAIDAMFGVKIGLEVSKGNVVEVNVPAGTQDGEVLRVYGRGLKCGSIFGYNGDLIMNVKVEIPNAKSYGIKRSDLPLMRFSKSDKFLNTKHVKDVKRE